MHVHKKCFETGPIYNEFILGAPKAASRSACPLETQRTLPVLGNSDIDLIFRLYNYCVFKGQVFSAPKRPQNDLWTTSGFQSEWPMVHKNPQTAFQVVDLIAICSTHGLIFPVALSNFSAMFQYGPAMGLWKNAVPWKKTAERNFLYGYDVAESSSDVDATSSSSNSSESSAETNMKTATWKSHDLLLGSGFTYRFLFSYFFWYAFIYIYIFLKSSYYPAINLHFW